jgi:peptidoglycan/LPS O-acetylase OafA/YrhL
MKQEKHSTMFARKGPLFYGPFGYLQAAMIGFLVGVVGFLAVGLMTSSSSLQTEIRDTWICLLCAAGGTALLLLLAIAGNYVIGDRIRRALEEQHLAEW